MKYTEDDILNRRVELESRDFISQYRTDPMKAKMPRSIGLSSYLSTSPELPDWLVNEPLGIREHHDREVHIGVTKLPGSDDLLYVVISEFEFSSLERESSTLILMLVFVGAIITVIQLIIGAILSKYISTPLIQLTAEIEQSDVNNIVDFSGSERNDEVGALSRAFTTSMLRLQQFLQREKQFTRYASHELRTPIALIRNSLAVLRLPDQNLERQTRNLQRIENATVEMSSLIDTFLLLGRNESASIDSKIDVSTLLQNCLAKNKSLNQASPLTIETNIKTSVLITSDTNLLGVLIDNIVRNLYKYCHTKARIELTPQYLIIENEFEGMKEKDAPGTESYGMEIIERISQLCRFDTSFSTDVDSFKVTLKFNQTN